MGVGWAWQCLKILVFICGFYVNWVWVLLLYLKRESKTKTNGQNGQNGQILELNVANTFLVQSARNDFHVHFFFFAFWAIVKQKSYTNFVASIASLNTYANALHN